MTQPKHDHSTRRQADQILAKATATRSLIDENARLTAPRRGSKTATEIQAAQMLRGTREWDHEDELSDLLEGREPKPVSRDLN